MIYKIYRKKYRLGTGIKVTVLVSVPVSKVFERYPAVIVVHFLKRIKNFLTTQELTGVKNIAPKQYKGLAHLPDKSLS